MTAAKIYRRGQRHSNKSSALFFVSRGTSVTSGAKLFNLSMTADITHSFGHGKCVISTTLISSVADSVIAQCVTKGRRRRRRKIRIFWLYA